MPSDKFWGQYTGQIASLLGGPTASVQILTEPQLLTGKTPAALAQDVARFCGQLPAWGSSYAPSDTSVMDAYQVVLTQIHETATNGKSVEKEYVQENARLSAMMGKASAYKTARIEAYVTAAATYREAGMTPPTFAAWFADNGLAEYRTQLAAQKAQAQKVRTLLQAAGIASPVVDALAALNDELATLKDALAAPVTLEPGVSVMAGWLDRPVDPGGLSFDQDEGLYDYSKSTWKSQSGVTLPGFVSIGARSGSGTRENVLKSARTYSVDIEFAARAGFDVTQGKWFDGAVLRAYKSGPWQAGSSFAMGTAHPYADADAIFPLLVTRFLAVLNPSVSITLDTREYSSVYETVSNNMASGISVGPFAFGGKGGSGTTEICQVSALSSTRTFTMRDTSGVPQIVGVTCEVMP